MPFPACRRACLAALQALAWGFAVLAVESRNQDQQGRCFSSSSDPAVSDQAQAPYVIQASMPAWAAPNGMSGSPIRLLPRSLRSPTSLLLLLVL